MEIYHEAQSFLKTFLVFKNKHAQWTGSKIYAIGAKYWFQVREISDTKSDIKPPKRPRMSQDMNGDGYLSCWSLNQVILKGYYWDLCWIWLGKRICGAADSATQKEKVRFVWLVTKRSRVQGVPTLGTRTIIDPDPCRKASFTSRSAVVNYGSVFGLDIGI